MGVVGMYHSGIGGGGFMLVRDEKGRYEVIDYRESAPAASHRDMYKHDKNASIVGGLAVGIPGEIRGLEYLHEKYGVGSLVMFVRNLLISDGPGRDCPGMWLSDRRFEWPVKDLSVSPSH